MITIATAMRRGLARRCPSCGEGPVFRGWYRLREKCEACGFRYAEPKGDNFAFMYLSMGALNGFLFFVIYFFGPENWWEKRFSLAAFALAANVLSIPFRKAMSLGFDLWVDEHDF